MSTRRIRTSIMPFAITVRVTTGTYMFVEQAHTADEALAKFRSRGAKSRAVPVLDITQVAA